LAVTPCSVNRPSSYSCGDAMSQFTESCVQFDGVDQYVDMGSVLGFDRTDSFSFSWWMKCGASGDTEYLLSKTKSGLPEGYAITITSAGAIEFSLTRVATSDCLLVSCGSGLRDNSWHHCVVTYDGTSLASGVTAYVDSVAVSVTSVYENLTGAIASDASFRVASSELTHPSNCFSGALVDVAVFSKVLTAVEVSYIYGSGIPADLDYLHNRTDRVAWWRMGNGLDVYPRLYNSKYPTGTVLNRGWWNPVSTVYDVTGSGMDAVTSADASYRWILDPRGTSKRYHAFPKTSPQTFDAGGVGDFSKDDPFSVSVWIRYTPTTSCLVIGKTSGLRGDGWQINIYDSGRICAYVKCTSSGTGRQAVRTTTAYNDGLWHHVVITHAGAGAGSLILYVDGAAATVTVEYNEILTGVLNQSDSSLLMGGFRSPGSTSDTSMFQGDMDDVALYSKVLTPSEVAEIYNSGVPCTLTLLGSATNLLHYWRMGDDPSPSAVANGTLCNMDASAVSDSAPGGVLVRSLLFTGASSQYATMGTVFSYERTQAMSLACWVNSSDNGMLIAKQTSATGTRGYSVAFVSGKIRFSLMSTATNAVIVETTSTYNDGAWKHVVVTYAGLSAAAGVIIYVNGAAVATTTVQNNLTTTTITSVGFRLGGRESGSYFTGLIADAAIYDRVLSEGEVTSMYNGGVPVDLSGLSTSDNLVGYWQPGMDIEYGAMTNQAAEDIVTDAPWAAPDLLEKTWSVVESFVVSPAGDTQAVQGQKILFDQKNQLVAIAGFTVVGSSNGTVYQYEGYTAGGSYGGGSTSPYDVWQTYSDVRFRSDPTGPIGWVVLRSPTTDKGTFYLTLVYYASSSSYLNRCGWILSSTKPLLIGDGAQNYPVPEQYTQFWDSPFFHYVAGQGQRAYAAACVVDGSFYYLTNTQSLAVTTGVFLFSTLSDAPANSPAKAAIALTAGAAITVDTFQDDWRLVHPDGDNAVGNCLLLAYSSANTVFSLMTDIDQLDGSVWGMPMFLFAASPTRSDSVSGFGGAAGRAPDFYLVPAGIAKGSEVPAKAPCQLWSPIAGLLFPGYPAMVYGA